MSGFSALRFMMVILTVGILAGSLAGMSACAPKDNYVAGGKRDRDGAGRISVETKSFSDKTPELTRHAMLQLANLTRYIDLAIGYRVGDRMGRNPQDPMPMGDGRIIQRLSPFYTRATDEAKVEAFNVVYGKVEPDNVDRTVMLDPKISGLESYVMTYDKNLPREGNAELMDYHPPIGIVVTTSPLEVLIEMRTGAKIKVRRSVNLVASEIEMTDKTVTYEITDTVVDRFTQDNLGTIVRDGSVTTKITGFAIKYDRASHAILEVHSGSIDLAVEGKKNKAGLVRTSDADNFNVSLSVLPTSALTAAASVCNPFAGTYSVSKDHAQALNLTVADAQITLDGFSAVPVAACTDPDHLNWVAEFASVFP